MSALLDRFADKLSNPWIIIGFLGQILFFGRFVVQWVASERKKQSIIPPSFWYFSLVGGVFLLAYSISIGDIVFTLGSSLNLVIYGRNLILIHSKKYQKFKP